MLLFGAGSPISGSGVRQAGVRFRLHLRRTSPVLVLGNGFTGQDDGLIHRLTAYSRFAVFAGFATGFATLARGLRRSRTRRFLSPGKLGLGQAAAATSTAAAAVAPASPALVIITIASRRSLRLFEAAFCRHLLPPLRARQRFQRRLR